MVLWGSMPVGRGAAGSLTGAHEDPRPAGAQAASDGSACGVISWLGNSNTSGRSPHHWPPGRPRLRSSGPAHLAPSARRCGWARGSGRGLGMGWCSSACGGRPSTSLRGESSAKAQPQTHKHPHSQGPFRNSYGHFPPPAGSLLEPRKPEALPGQSSLALLPRPNLHLFL